MKGFQFACAAIFVAMMSTAALADDPNDPAMRSAAARAHDREIIRQLNLRELARVRERDARYAAGWRAWRGDDRGTEAEAAYGTRSRDYERNVDSYAQDRVEYERQMTAWRRAVAACRAGDYAACGD